ncbi:hypothetical protein PAQ31011_03663 [Pandoraea aquatica]|uniref:Uncharacterized protein n=1 Tax=Pandoraea aquatica TaxID=2508290 RepID=A0A5E4X3V7_9BURK|nr:hypothetical protein [Pandoraea aquatica]VVE30956.1 hypothetical protein PAQ31011_03663 [Pandoraea aquatica]
MITSLSSPLPALSSDTAYSLRAQSLEECANARSELDLESLWGRIKDWFFGTHRVDAKKALFRILNAETTHALYASFIDMLRYIEPEHRNQLAWIIDDIGRPSFLIGPYLVPWKADWASLVPSEPPLSVADMAKLLLSLRYKRLPVLETLREVGLRRISEVAHERPFPEKKAEVDADRMCEAQQWFLRQSPSLGSALELIGLHRNDENGDLAYQLRCEVKTALTRVCANDDQAAATSHNAENLMRLVSTMFHDREHLKRVALSVNLTLRSSLNRAS